MFNLMRLEGACNTYDPAVAKESILTILQTLLLERGGEKHCETRHTFGQRFLTQLFNAFQFIEEDTFTLPWEPVFKGQSIFSGYVFRKLDDIEFLEHLNRLDIQNISRCLGQLETLGARPEIEAICAIFSQETPAVSSSPAGIGQTRLPKLLRLLNMFLRAAKAGDLEQINHTAQALESDTQRDENEPMAQLPRLFFLLAVNDEKSVSSYYDSIKNGLYAYFSTEPGLLQPK
jgi:hypothetical protein